MKNMETKIHCSMRDKNFLEPCDALNRGIVGAGVSRIRSGVFMYSMVDTKDRKPTANYFAIRGGKSPEGLAMNFCPFCGTDIVPEKYKRRFN